MCSQEFEGWSVGGSGHGITKQKLAEAFDTWLALYRLNPAGFMPVVDGHITADLSIDYGDKCASFIWSLAGLENEPGAVKP